MKRSLRTAVVAFAVALVLASSIPYGLASTPSPSPSFKYISLTALPHSLPTSASKTTSYPALIVSITDQLGDPTVAPNDTLVYLSSSDPAVLVVQSTVTIPAGAQYATATVSTTATPGNSTVTAVSLGYEAASVVFSTHEPRGYPSQLEIYPLPGSLPAGSPLKTNFTAIVEDAAGLPARTIQTTTIHATSSDTSVLQIGDVTIPANKTVGYGVMTTTGEPGSASITASAQGLVSSSAYVTVVSGASAPIHLLVSSPATLPADGGTYRALTVSFLDNTTKAAPAPAPVQVLLSSSRPDLAAVPQSVTVPAGRSFVIVPVYTSQAAGQAFITASALNFTSYTLKIETVSIPPTKLGMYVSDPVGLISPTANTLDFVVQLQDSSGLPAQARSAATVIVSFSDRSLLLSPITLTIGRGTDLAYASVPLTKTTSGTFTAISNGLFSASVQFSAAPLGVTNTMGPSSNTIHTNQTAYVYYSLHYQGLPAAGASVTWTASSGSISATAPTTDPRGSASALFTPSGPGDVTIHVSVTDPAVGTVNSTTHILVIEYPPKASPSILTRIIKSPLYLGAIVAAVAAAIVAVFVIRRRRVEKVEDDDSFSLGPGPGEGTALDLRAVLSTALFRR